MKITMNQLRRIIREEIAREDRRQMNEGFFSHIGDYASAVFTGKVDGQAVPPGVSKGDWVTILGAAKAASPERKASYIADMTARVKKQQSVITYKSWLQDVESEEEFQAQMSASEKRHKEAERRRREEELADLNRWANTKQRMRDEKRWEEKREEERLEAEKQAKEEERARRHKYGGWVGKDMDAKAAW